MAEIGQVMSEWVGLRQDLMEFKLSRLIMFFSTTLENDLCWSSDLIIDRQKLTGTFQAKSNR
ncbi:MAG: hypothetical protein EBW65_08890 [Gammaproteobacteria bacterium]|nr:hypothetical protein [Gammaproteobacteria bacterium]